MIECPQDVAVTQKWLKSSLITLCARQGDYFFPFFVIETITESNVSSTILKPNIKLNASNVLITVTPLLL